MTLENGTTHISWWPGTDQTRLPLPRPYNFLIEANTLMSGRLRFGDDNDLEEREPDVAIKINGLDEAAIEAW